MKSKLLLKNQRLLSRRFWEDTRNQLPIILTLVDQPMDRIQENQNENAIGKVVFNKSKLAFKSTKIDCIVSQGIPRWDGADPTGP